jgi:hypothetical protein
MAKTTVKKRKVNVESSGQAHVSATFNNIIISLVMSLPGLLPGKWDLKGLRKTPLMQPK